MIREFVALRADLEVLKNAFGRAIKVGPVEEVDPVKGYRLKLGESGGRPFLSPWYPHPETGKTSVPLKKGQVVGVINPVGDPRQGVLIRGGYSDGQPAPNDDMEANVFEDAGVRIEAKGGVVFVQASKVVVEAGDVSLGGEGGKRVARVGDKVHVQSGSSSGFWPIVEGSSTVTAVD
jgi:phage baseplate assembly protein gpV